MGRSAAMAAMRSGSRKVQGSSRKAIPCWARSGRIVRASVSV